MKPRSKIPSFLQKSNHSKQEKIIIKVNSFAIIKKIKVKFIKIKLNTLTNGLKINNFITYIKNFLYSFSIIEILC